jgi:hypothetical protein
MNRSVSCTMVPLMLVAFASAQSTVRVSVSPQGLPGNGYSFYTSISADGRYVAFSSLAGNPLPQDTNGYLDVFVWDRATGQLELATVDSKGEQEWGLGSALSADGRYVAYYGELDGLLGAIVRDRQAGQTRFINVRSDGIPVEDTSAWWGRISITPDGRFVAFDSDAALVENDGPVRDTYVHDRDADGNGVFDEPGGIATVRVSVSSAGVPANADTRYPEISSNGRFVTFTCFADNLVPGDTNGDRDIFLHDRDPDENGVFDEPGSILTERISVASGGGQAAVVATWWSSVTDDGRYVVFHSAAPDLVPGDTNNASDVFLRDRLLNQTERLNHSPLGTQANGTCGIPQISNDGRWVTYTAWASNILTNDSNGINSDFIAFDRMNRSNKLVNYTSQGVQSLFAIYNEYTQQKAAAISADGRFCAIVCEWQDMAIPPSSESQIYLRDRGPHFLADIDGAGHVNIDDLLAVVSAWGDCPAAPVACAADITGDGVVGIDDLLLIIGNWG